MSDIPRPPTRRPPLGEATRRINNSQRQQQATSSNKVSPIPHHESLQADGLLQVHNAPISPLSQSDYNPLREYFRAGSPGSNVANPRLSAISKEYPNSNRNSQISTVSTNASDGKRIKQCIGPWKLGKTLGKGATARVRLARHTYTGKEAAIKIVQKKNAQMSQAGSLADLDRAESVLPDSGEGLRRMPVGIEREVAIMKLIQHPNIMKLYDIWENRTEIYLVLEYVDNGELFEHIAGQGRLNETEAIKYFRQMLSAVGYCHSFNICHRDLKPENILLTKDNHIKIADFGMAALHQGPDHKLKTSCGSPHYAAPELIRGVNYRGDKVDIWSMGVILYAMLAGRLPFDVEGLDNKWLGPLLSKIRKGSYDMDPDFSPEAASLIWRILQVNPRDRISLDQIWRHPLIRKYDHLDDLGRGPYPQSPNVKDCVRTVLRRSDINKELLRQLRSMWHTLSEEELIDKLLSEEPNDQKLFYSLLLKYRDAQLENYSPEIGLGYSTSDYHHVRPLTLTKTYSTCHFPQPKTKSHGRQASRFTVISNIAETEQSYDPFKASRPQHIDGVRAADRAKVTIHRDRDTETALPRQISRASSRQRSLAPPRGYASRSSLASSTRSRNSAVRASSYKRGVSFNHIRKRSSGSGKRSSADILLGALVGRHSNHTEVTDDGGDFLRPVGTPASTRYIRSRKAQSAASQPLLSTTKPARMSLLWNEDVRQLSTSLANDCDEAFNRSSVMSDMEGLEKSGVSEKRSSAGDRSTLRKQTATSLSNNGQLANQKAKRDSLDTRPLPPPPARSDSMKIELLEARKQAELRKTSGGGESPGYLDRMVSHIDRLIQPGSPTISKPERRTLSAPVESRRISTGRPLPSIYEAKGEESSPHRIRASEKSEHQRRNDVKNNRIASAPEPRVSKTPAEDRFTRPEPLIRGTIRVVAPSSPISPVKMPAPLTIRKKSSRGGPPPEQQPPVMFGGLSPDTGIQSARRRPSGLELRQQYLAGSRLDLTPDLGRIDEDYMDEIFANDSNPGTIVKKKPTWFRKSSKGGDDDFRMSIPGSTTMPSQSSSNDTVRPRQDPELPVPPKKRGFSIGRLFKKRNSKPDMTVSANDNFDDDSSLQDSMVDAQRQYHAGRVEDARARQIEPHQNWLAKLFHVKPVAKFVCFSVSKRRARQEITTILKEWKRYGIRDVQIDKERNIVFGKVAAKNYLDMKEVSFAGEIMTVIEHGKRSHLSIARFTQERGAASSFHKVVETLETVLKCRGMLVSDERKKRMMVKTLNAA